MFMGFRRWDDVEEFSEMGPLITDVMDQDSLVLLAGPFSSMKSFIALSWACSVATGHPWMGHPVQRGRAMYLAAEGYRRFPARVRAWVSENGTAVPGTELLLRSGVLRMTPDVLRSATAEWHRFVGRVSEAQPGLVVIDTLAMAIAGDEENSFSTMTSVTTLARQVLSAAPGCSVVIVHHFGKDPSRGASGHVALSNNSDFVYHAQPGNRRPLTDGGFVELSCVKNRDDERIEPKRLCLKPAGDNVVAVPFDETLAAATTSRVEIHRSLQAQGLSHRAIAERTGHPKSTVGRDLAPFPPRTGTSVT